MKTPPAEEAPPRVVARIGAEKGVSLDVLIRGGELEHAKKDGQSVRGVFPASWTRAVVKTTTKAGTRAFVIEPAHGDEGIEHGVLFARGGFVIVETLTTTAAAKKKWKAFGLDMAAS